MEKAAKEKKTCKVCYCSVEVEKLWQCAGKRNDAECSVCICFECFADWLGGRNRDNKGWIHPTCWSCKTDVPYEVVKRMLGDAFDAFDDKMVQFVLSVAPGVLYCPGVDCPMVYFRPPTRRQKKKGQQGAAQCHTHTCGECETEMCALCGEKWHEQHEGKRCNQYAKWKKENDEELKAMREWANNKGNRVKACPGCSKLTEKNGGCNHHFCVHCDFEFCYNCCYAYNDCHCSEQAQKLRAKREKRRAKRKAKRERMKEAKAGKGKEEVKEAAAAAAAEVTVGV